MIINELRKAVVTSSDSIKVLPDEAEVKRKHAPFICFVETIRRLAFSVEHASLLPDSKPCSITHFYSFAFTTLIHIFSFPFCSATFRKTLACLFL